MKNRQKQQERRNFERWDFPKKKAEFSANARQRNDF
jgi:hypothetical protein